MKILPAKLKQILFKHKTKAHYKKGKYKTRINPREALKNRYIDHLSIQRYSNEDVVSGLDIWLIQIYFSIVKMLPDCTYEDFINAFFTITSGDYNTIERTLLSAILIQETSMYLMQNATLQNPNTSKSKTRFLSFFCNNVFAEKSCLLYAKYVNKLKMCLISENNNTLLTSKYGAVKKANNYPSAMTSQVCGTLDDERKSQKKLYKKQKKNKNDPGAKELLVVFFCCVSYKYKLFITERKIWRVLKCSCFIKRFQNVGQWNVAICIRMFTWKTLVAT